MKPKIFVESEVVVAGQKTVASVEGSEPLFIEILCFVTNPPPADYKPCPECGSFSVNSGEQFDVKASYRLFSLGNGHLEVSVLDSQGNKVTKKIDVLSNSGSQRQSNVAEI